jgi:hypothetical protein
VEKRFAEKISEINLPFEEELRTIEEEVDVPFSQGPTTLHLRYLLTAYIKFSSVP